MVNFCLQSYIFFLLFILFLNFITDPTLFYVALGLYDTHSFEWPFLLKFPCTKIVKPFVFLVQSNVFQHRWVYVFKFMKQYSFNKFLSTIFLFWNWVFYIYALKGPRKWGLNLLKIWSRPNTIDYDWLKIRSRNMGEEGVNKVRMSAASCF